MIFYEGKFTPTLKKSHPNYKKSPFFKQLFPDFVLGGTMWPLVAPWPTQDPLPDCVELYMTCASGVAWARRVAEAGGAASA